MSRFRPSASTARIRTRACTDPTRLARPHSPKLLLRRNARHISSPHPTNPVAARKLLPRPSCRAATTSRTSHPAIRASCDADFSSILPIPRPLSSSFTTSTSMRASPASLASPRDQCRATTPIAGANPVATSTALSRDRPSSRTATALAVTASPTCPSSPAMSAASDGTAERTSTPCSRRPVATCSRLSSAPVLRIGDHLA